MKTIQDMAREAGFSSAVGKHIALDKELERFAELVRKDYSTIHANIWLDRIHKFMLEEREACAKVCDRMAQRTQDIRSAALESAAENIRARAGEQK